MKSLHFLENHPCIQNMDASQKPTSLTRISVIPWNTCIQNMDASQELV